MDKFYLKWLQISNQWQYYPSVNAIKSKSERLRWKLLSLYRNDLTLLFISNKLNVIGRTHGLHHIRKYPYIDIKLLYFLALLKWHQ